MRQPPAPRDAQRRPQRCPQRRAARWRPALAAVVLACHAAAVAASGALERVLAAPMPPPGVVFEVVSGDESALERVLPAIHEQVRRLRARFPDLRVAVLTHGNEQFSLTTGNAGRYAAVHALAATLADDEQVPVQVCGNHAAYRGKGTGDFPAHVGVVSSAGEKLDEYRAAGYVVILP